MRFDNRLSKCAWGGLLIVAACLAMGQSCNAPATSNVPVASACGLHAAYCVEVVGKSPIALASADFNGDGWPDVAAANFGTDNVEILLNDGAGVLVPSGRYKVGDSPGAIVVADFNGDGKPDLAASDGLGVAVLLNRGDGTFASAVHVELDQTINAIPLSVTAADLNGDGAIDLAASAMGWTFDFEAVTSTNADNVAILLNDGTGHFSLANTIRIENPFPRLGDITSGDVDRDGRPDLVVDQSSGRVLVLRNQGAGQFGDASVVFVGENHILSDVKLADLDGDGWLDLMVADNGDWLDPNNNGGSVAIYSNRGGSFELASVIATGMAPTSIAPADYNGDGRLDLAVANNLSNDVAILLNLGGGTFGTPVRFATGEGPTSVVAADFNGDGSLDLSVSHMISGAIGVYLDNGAGCFTCGQ